MSLMPLNDVTNATNIQRRPKPTSPTVTAAAASPLLPSAQSAASPSRVRHDPYSWHFVADDTNTMGDPTNTTEVQTTIGEMTHGEAVCMVVVQHKCHTTECASGRLLRCGQYVVIRGDRGVDVGVVARVSAITHPLPAVSVLRYATQEEVDFWATSLKALEASALEFCRQRVQRHRLPMDVRHAEFQFDQKKLIFYYDAGQRVDFVMVLRELYREFGCRIWMENV